MNFTFGIITYKNQEENINKIIDSIENQNISNYEIIVVGSFNESRKNTKIISFDETIKHAWISKKKNVITDNASYKNIVYLHDYIMFMEGWYDGFLRYGDKFHICMNPILNTDNTRFRDWTLWDYPLQGMEEDEKLLPYDMTHLSAWMYISGTYWVAKKDVMDEFPIDETLGHGEGEDIVWSFQVRNKYDFSINTNSKVKLLPSFGKGWKSGWKDPAHFDVKEGNLKKLKILKSPRRLSNVFGHNFLLQHPQLMRHIND